MTTLTRPFDIDQAFRQTALTSNANNEIKAQAFIESDAGKEMKEILKEVYKDVSFNFSTPTEGEVKEHDRKVAQKDKALRSFQRAQEVLEEKIADGKVDLDEATTRIEQLESHIEKIDDASRSVCTAFVGKHLESVVGWKGVEPDQKFTDEFLISDNVPQVLFWMIYQEIRAAGFDPELKGQAAKN